MLKIKELEKKILLNLLENGQQPILKIAKDLGVTRQTVAKKLDQMQNSGLILSFFPKLQPEILGLSIQAYILMREDPKNDCRKETEDIVKSFPQVTEFQRIFGKYDSIAKVLVNNNKELTELVKKIHDLKGVKETETFIVHSTLKDKPEDPIKQKLTE
ncbi:MAG: Lrp/AsnC family transcriptional regulator [Candidatus Bathyarchaeota archaeon]|nr:Lrp/AsnC family transcriptional regulator [Candidatus Bathyarchaeum tardum]WGM89115.1 MAG: Lrp/AsnC family transcriptional regulator [Candidatus Bathyarchaeum tardum]WNZ28645.1 MAG: Lrp/AsnC family transcriptional regulator [Candidatus Bathyarchaeota archaeon]